LSQDVSAYTDSPHCQQAGIPDGNEGITSLEKSYLHSTDEELAQENDVGKTKAQNKSKSSPIQLQSQEHRLGKKNQIYTRRRPSKSNFHLRY